MRILLLFLFLVCYTPSLAQIRVCNECPINSIQDAIDLSNPYDSIIVVGGSYKENSILIDKPLSIIGRNRPIIDGESMGYVIEIEADSVTLSGFHILNVGLSHTKDYAAIHAYSSDYLKIHDNTLENVFFGILVEKSSFGSISNNHVRGESSEEFLSGNGVHLWHCDNMLIYSNNLSVLRDGIYLEFVDDSKVINNESFGNIRYGLHYMFSNRDEYEDNHFHHNGAGVAVMFSKFIIMKNNTFSENWGATSYGLLLKEIYDAEITNNTFRGNSVAVNIDGSTRINYKQNDFLENGWAIKVTGGCYANNFNANNFVSNSFDLSYNSKLNDNQFNGNFWSSYTGYDLDKDGFGDVPFRPVKLFSYVVNRTPETIVLLRSLFIDIINFSEKVTPVFTPDKLMDHAPSMKRVSW